MVIYVLVSLVVGFIFGYCVGANNPWSSVRAKIKAEAQTTLTNISKKI